MSKSTKPRLTIEELERERCFTNLTPKQQLMVRTFIASNGDRVLSVRTAYNAKNAEVARVMSYEYFANPKVIACLTAYFQDDPLDIFKEEVRRAFRNQKLTLAQMQAMHLYCDLNGWGSASLPRLNGYEPVERPPKSRAKASKVTSADPLDRVPEGATPLLDKAGVLRGYKTASGEYVQLADVQAE